MPSRDWGSIECEQVVVPEIHLPFDQNTVVEQLHVINPLGESANFGIDLYERAVNLVSGLTE